MQHLFVYGTLAPNRANHHIMAPIAGDWQPARIRGHLLANGWGAATGYPAIVIDVAADWVTGFLFSSDQLAAHWARLDMFESDAYQRVLVDVVREDGATCQAYVYALNDKDAQHAPIART